MSENVETVGGNGPANPVGNGPANPWGNKPMNKDKEWKKKV